MSSVPLTGHSPTWPLWAEGEGGCGPQMGRPEPPLLLAPRALRVSAAWRTPVPPGSGRWGEQGSCERRPPAGRLTVLLPSRSHTSCGHPGPGHCRHSHQPHPDPGDPLQRPPVLDPRPPAAAQVSGHVVAFQRRPPAGGKGSPLPALDKVGATQDAAVPQDGGRGGGGPQARAERWSGRPSPCLPWPCGGRGHRGKRGLTSAPPELIVCLPHTPAPAPPPCTLRPTPLLCPPHRLNCGSLSRWCWTGLPRP